MKKLVLAVSAAAMFAIPAAPAAAWEPPYINCGIVSCTEQVERKVEFTQETAGGIVEDAVACVKGTVGAIENALNGYPQPYAC